MIKGKKISAMLPKTWKKSFDNGVVIPPKMRFCKECADKLTSNNSIFKLTKIHYSRLI